MFTKWCVVPFHAAEIEDRGGGGILLLSYLSFCHSVILLFYPLWNFYLANNFWAVSTRAFIFHIRIPCDKTFPCYPVTLTLEFDILFGNLNLANNFWIVSASALIFYISISCDKTFPWVPLLLIIWPWPRCLTYFLKTLTLLINFEHWVLKHWYCTWVFLVIRPFRGYHYFRTYDPDLKLWPIFESFNLANNFWTVSARALIFHMNIPCDMTFLWIPVWLTLWPWPQSFTYFFKTLILLITFEFWVLELWYFTWIFFLMRSFCTYFIFWPWHFTNFEKK